MNEHTIPAFPDGLLNWAGHRDGGVKKPFSANSGRPTGQQIETGLTQRLQRWASALSMGEEETPVAIFLVGGPGNGKTDAIETVVEFLDNALNCYGKLIYACKDKFDVELPPRKIIVDLSEILDKSNILHIRKLAIVQDATEVDLELPEKTPEALFLEDVESLVTSGSRERSLFLCGINRGILAHAALVGHAENRDPAALEFIDRLTLAATSGVEGTSCWPLKGYEWAVGWPMDVESLVDHSILGDELAPARKVLEKALELDDWTPECDAGELCPFHTNSKLLRNSQAQQHFVEILHYYELASGKRWNFRDLFSLISHVFVGHESTFNIDSKRVSPCEWAAYHAKNSQSPRQDAIISAWLLASRLYTHALFPTWPRLDDIEKINIEQFCTGSTSGIDQFFRKFSSNRDWESTDIGRLLGEDFCLALDPANTRRELNIRDELSIGQIEDAFTSSIRRGIELTRGYLTKIELNFIELLSAADVSCEPDFVSSPFHAKAKYVQWHLRALASRFTKRSLAGSVGICRDYAYLKKYKALFDGSGDSARHLTKSFERLLTDSRSGLLSIPLSTTFGQPPDSKWGGAYLVGRGQPHVKMMPMAIGNSLPRGQLLYLKAEGLPVPITFSLFKALSELEEGLMPASLPGEIFALVDGTRNLLAGRLVHDKDWLEGARIVIGESNQELVIEEGKITEV